MSLETPSGVEDVPTIGNVQIRMAYSFQHRKLTLKEVRDRGVDLFPLFKSGVLHLHEVFRDHPERPVTSEGLIARLKIGHTECKRLLNEQASAEMWVLCNESTQIQQYDEQQLPCEAGGASEG
jgi:hypothetical protein